MKKKEDESNHLKQRWNVTKWQHEVTIGNTVENLHVALKDKRKIAQMKGFLEKQKWICLFARGDKENKWGAVKFQGQQCKQTVRDPFTVFPLPRHPSFTTVVTSPQKPLRQTGFHSDFCLSASTCIKDGFVGGG